VLVNQIDLHTHTTASDGTLSPAELVAYAASKGIRVLGVTDHDTTAGLAPAIQAGLELGVQIIPGVEINTDVPEGELHVLGYFIDWHDAFFQGKLSELRDGRMSRAEKMVRKLRALGLSITLDQVLRIAGPAAVARPHVAAALVEKGYVSTPAEAFDRYIGRHGPAYVERMRFTPAEAVRLIRQVGGVPVWAHPVIIGAAEAISDPLDLEAMLPELVTAGLQGIECYYTGYPPEVTRDLLGLAARYGLIATGGSDYHGPQRLNAELGEVEVPASVVDQLKMLASE
jgi:predicted metal-dependent phosphoesterase TrpH